MSAMAYGSKGGQSSKAIASQFHHKQGESYNKHAHAITHHWGAGGGGSHYHMSGRGAV